MDITPAILDPELGCTAFTVKRITYTRTSTGTYTSSTLNYSASGCIHPGTPEMLALLPEEEKADEFISIYTTFDLRLGTPESEGGTSFTGPDRIVWNNKHWRVVRLKNWQQLGYSQAYAVLVQE